MNEQEPQSPNSQSAANKKKEYRPPELRIYGPLTHMTHVMWWGFYPDRLGRLSFWRPPWKMKMWMS
ncbi:MAG: hypothetical protein D6820_15335 [Lentisphaerae bacterium]|nr:MAG: hypothetical protein D6820_15335 [Lentisphaerota bacterium]